uniref:Fucosyltransferase n=1 Tax=Ciona savignyi TaxID=51511 RepID=H2ZAJ6_CIOSA
EKLILINDPQFGDVHSYTCPGCHVTYDKSTSAIADAVVFHCVTRRDSILGMPSQRSPNQRWVWWCAEPPWNTRYVFDKTLVNFHRVFNWTMTYRVDSDVYLPYSIDLSGSNIKVGKYNYSLKKGFEVLAAKTSLAAWVSSNCAVAERSNTIRELQRYMNIDIFGKCGTKPLFAAKWKTKRHFLIFRYKFYFAFENSRCKDYISEKFWRNGLGTGAIPVVIGPKRGDYELVAPPNSFIHVDDFQSLEALASYLNKLDKDDQLYGEYLRWKVGEFPGWSREIPTSRPYDEIKALAESRKWGTHGICAICEKLKSNPKPSVVDRLDLFWYGSGYSPDSEQFSVCSPKSG